jgi:hypothetical protein
MTSAGSRAAGLSVDICYEGGTCLSVQQKQIVFGEVAASIIAAWQAPGPPKNRGGAFRFRCPRAAPPSKTIRHLHDQFVRRQGDTL